MTREQDPSRINSLIQESRRLKLERSFEHAERYLETALKEDPNDRDALSALAVLLLEGGQYSKANHITRRLTTLIANEETAETLFISQLDSDCLRRDKDAEDDISADLALSRQIAVREGFYSRTTEATGESEPKDGKGETGGGSQGRPIGEQVEVGREPSSYFDERRGAVQAISPELRHSAIDQSMLGLDDQMPISRQSVYGSEPQARQQVPPIHQPELDLDDLMPTSRQSEEDRELNWHGVDIDSLADGISDDDEGEEDTDWSDELPQERQSFDRKSVSNAPLELDEDYAEDAFSESPTPEELTSIPDAKSTRERAQEVALELIYEYGLGDEYRLVLTRIFTEYWWSRCKTSMREQLELAVSAKALDMARQIREHWAESPEFHENISDYQRHYSYVSLPWRLAIRLVDAYRQYPQFEEIVGFLGFWHDEWDTRNTLRRRFPSFYSMVKHIVERSESDDVDPSAVLDLLRRVED